MAKLYPYCLHSDPEGREGERVNGYWMKRSESVRLWFNKGSNLLSDGFWTYQRGFQEINRRRRLVSGGLN